MSRSPFNIRQTAHAGRYLTAATPLPEGTTVLQTSPPVLSVIMREYRREVCAHCFQYDRGRNLPVRDGRTGKAFCNEQHRGAWEAEAGHDARAAWEAVEEYVRRRGAREIEMADADAPRPTVEAIEAAWAGVAKLGDAVREARSAAAAAATTGQATSKRHRKAVREALEASERVVDADVLSFLLAGTLLHARATSGQSTVPPPPPPPPPPPSGADTTPTTQHNGDGNTNTNSNTNNHGTPDPTSPPPSPSWASLLTLAATATPYPTAQNLTAHTHGYLLLLALLPARLLPALTTAACRAAPRHEVHNSFGLRSLGDGGDEFLGYGVWPEASLFNHSCAPNVAKARGGGGGGGGGADVRGSAAGVGGGGSGEGVGGGDGPSGRVRHSDGRMWAFWTTRDVAEGEELAISYLGGEEATLDVLERRRRLMATWGFECCCAKCLREAGQGRS